MTVSNILIIISAVITALTFFIHDLTNFGINHTFLSESMYNKVLIQFLLYQFLHGGIIHLVFNSLFIYIFGNGLEDLIGKRKFIIFFIFNTIFVGISLFLFTSGNTIGISGFCMAILTYFTLELYNKNNPEYKGGITAIVINIGIGLTPGISLIGHLFGSIAGVIFYLYNREKKELN
ncbi:MAG: rhomboid family intramembrane serine protease [Candidatus Gracilibacteria bacterium]